MGSSAIDGLRGGSRGRSIPPSGSGGMVLRARGTTRVGALTQIAQSRLSGTPKRKEVRKENRHAGVRIALFRVGKRQEAHG